MLVARPSQEVCEHLKRLEMSLHTVEVRSDQARLGGLLHDEFVEFGRSGKIYSKCVVLEEFQDYSQPFDIVSRDYQFAEIGAKAVLVTYRSAHLDSNRNEHRHSLRSSIWQKTEQGWVMRFHQGTAID